MHWPIEYRWLKAHGFNFLTPWHFIEPVNSEGLRNEYQKETGFDILPFARRQDNDDIAGFKVVGNEVQKIVLTVHLTWSSKLEKDGYPITRESPNLIDWIKAVMLPDSQEWITEDELHDILGSKKN
jgi:hypothetical protein